jgi:hypothetical protein
MIRLRLKRMIYTAVERDDGFEQAGDGLGRRAEDLRLQCSECSGSSRR